MLVDSKERALETIPPLVGTCGRADLLYALALVQEDVAEEMTGRELAMAEVFEFYPKPEKQPPDDDKDKKTGPEVNKTSDLLATDSNELNDVFCPFRLVAVETLQTNEQWQVKRTDSKKSGNLTEVDMEPWDELHPLPKALPIVPWARLWPRLRLAVAYRHASGIDFKRLSDCVARGIAIRQLPRLSRLAWPNPLTVILDYSDRLTPYWDDWHWLRQQLQNSLHQQAKFYRLHGIPQKPLQYLSNGKSSGLFIDWPKLNAGSTLLLVSDLGMVDTAHPWPSTCWQNKLNDFRRLGVRVVVLAPVSVKHLQPLLVNAAQTVRLSPDSTLRPVSRMRVVTDASGQDNDQDTAVSKILLAMMSVATRIEPALLRDLRRCLPRESGDAGLEGEVWCHQHMDTSAIACAVSPHAIKQWREKFQILDTALQQRTLACLRDWHAPLPQAIHHEETLVWRYLAQSSEDASNSSDIKNARRFFQRVTNSLQEKNTRALNSETQVLQIQLADRHLQWVSPTLATKEAYIAQLSVAINQAQPQHSGLPDGMDLIAWLQAWPAQTVHRLRLIQQIDLSLHLSADYKPETAALGRSPLADLELDRSVVLWAREDDGHALIYRPWHWQSTTEKDKPVLPQLFSLPAVPVKQPSVIYIHTGWQKMQFERFEKPSWAAGIGQDNYGLYADLEINSITQRFRWINPGVFRMGSAKGEAERISNEDQHQVTLSQGYWLADSACTQALWVAVMNDNPSHFNEITEHPVENISYDDVLQFIGRLNKSQPGLLARLPSEAEWEYACRAGTTTAFSFGRNITPEQVNYDGNYPYAGVAKGEYRGTTVAVKSLAANPWGLYEMHGNVVEWCADWYGDYKDQGVKDPTGPSHGFYRVLRGGPWSIGARYARSADRDRLEPAGRHDFIGFRLALDPVGVSTGEHDSRYTVDRLTVAAEPDSQTGQIPDSSKPYKK